VNPAMGPGSAPGLRSGTVTATVTPAVAKGAVVRLLLDARSVTAPFAVAPQVTTTSATGTVKFAIDDVPAGSYRALVEVDGVRGLPDRDAAGEWILVMATL